MPCKHILGVEKQRQFPIPYTCELLQISYVIALNVLLPGITRQHTEILHWNDVEVSEVESFQSTGCSGLFGKRKSFEAINDRGCGNAEKN